MRTKRLIKFRHKRYAQVRNIVAIFVLIPLVSIFLGYLASVFIIPNFLPGP